MLLPAPSLAWSLILTFALTTTTVALAEDSVPDNAEQRSVAERIKGDWVQYRDTPNGRFTTIKQHLGTRTVLTTYDPDKRVV